LSLLFVFHDQAANFPVAVHHRLIDTLPHMATCLLDDCGDLAGQCCECIFLRGWRAIHCNPFNGEQHLPGHPLLLP
jgi:hypothetical protein